LLSILLLISAWPQKGSSLSSSMGRLTAECYFRPSSSGARVSGLRNRQNGFTLVELLVTISIIGLLAGLSIPAIKAAQDKAKQATCSSNLKQLGVALSSYLAENNGVFPGLHTQANATIVWPHRLRPYLGNNHNLFWCPAENRNAKWPVTYTSPTPHSNPQLASYGYYQGEAIFNPETRFSYGYNDAGTIGDQGLGSSIDDQARPLPRITQIVKPSQMVAIGDTTSDGSWDAALDPTNDREAPKGRHGGGANILCVDGHVENVRVENLRSKESQWASRWNRTGETR
jgi:prepilin-type N-terminal cleavage/methylation domain-containing protein/prepilin-type processing-associated H-X9-DG protein